MSVLTIILGILMILAGEICLATPVATTFGLMYFYMILMFVTGIIFLVKCFVYKRYGIDLFFAIITILAGGFMLFTPNLSFATTTVLLYITAGWLIFRGIVGVINAFSARKLIGGGLFALSLIVSILVILAGIYSFIHPLVFAGFLGILACCYFIVEGVDMIFLGCIGKQIEHDIK